MRTITPKLGLHKPVPASCLAFQRHIKLVHGDDPNRGLGTFSQASLRRSRELSPLPWLIDAAGRLVLFEGTFCLKSGGPWSPWMEILASRYRVPTDLNQKPTDDWFLSSFGNRPSPETTLAPKNGPPHALHRFQPRSFSGLHRVKPPLPIL